MAKPLTPEEKEKRSLYRKAWREANKDRERETLRAYYESHKSAIKESRRAWAKANKKPRKPMSDEQKQRQRAYQKAWYEENRERLSAMAKKRHDANPEKVKASLEASSDRRKDYMLRWHYGISLSEYNARKSAQQGVCAICGSAEKLYVDHDHATSEVRGLLCHKCNAAIGLMGEDPDVLRKAIEYLRIHTLGIRVIDGGQANG